MGCMGTYARAALGCLAALWLASGAVYAELPSVVVHNAKLDASPIGLIDGLGIDPASGVKVMKEPDGTTILTYAGLDIPRPLATFISNAVPNLDPTALQAGRMVNLNLIMIPQDGGTTLRLMMFENARHKTPAAFRATFGTDLPPDAEVLLNEDAGPCSGQSVIAMPLAADTAAETLNTRMDEQGLTVTRMAQPDGTLLLGEVGQCSVFVYIEPDQDAPQRSMVVVRYLED